MRTVVTGASGFVGSAVVMRLLRTQSAEVIGTYRRRVDGAPHVPGLTRVTVGEIGPDTDWKPALQGADVVVHTAALVHQLRKFDHASSEDYHRVNAAGTLNLARQGAEAGVRRLVYLSTIKVNGEFTPPGAYFTAEDQPNPGGAYAESKWNAEKGLIELSRASDMETVVIRPPLVYGPGVRANFLALLRWIDRGWPLPFGSVDNRRSLIALDNLVDFIALCAVHPVARNQIFTVADGEDMSTGELARRIGSALNRPAKLAPIPVGLIRGAGLFTGRRQQVNRLIGSLLVDVSKARTLLGWKRVVSVESALQDTARYFRDHFRS